MKGEELTEMGDLLASGACGFSDDGVPVRNPEVMRRALEYSGYFGSFVSCHEEDFHLTNGGSIHEGKVSAEYGFRGIPTASESVMVARDVELARLTGGHVHICHLSGGDSLRIIEQAKNDGVRVTAEVTHNHLTFTEELCIGYDTVSKVNPPLRTENDRLALIEGLKSGVIDCLISDHAPHHIDDKFKEYDYAAFGMTGLQTIIPAMVKLIDDGIISWTDFARASSAGPARVLGLADRGRLEKGYRADITVIDPNMEYIFDENINLSKSVNTPFWGKKMKGKAICVIRGEVLLGAQ
jgi:dihydroorotase